LIGSISIRVLAENYDKAVVALRGLAIDVITETSSSQDVTQEYTDLGSQVKNLEATEAQLLKIMAAATKTEDVLAVQQQLTTVQGQIEQDKGRMQYLERTSATSLIQINLKEAVIDVKFNADKINLDTNQSVRFISQISGGFTPYNYQWDFGDGKTATDPSPSHSYNDPGIYTVTLKVTDDKGYTNSISRDAYITVTGNWNPAGVARSAWIGFTAFGRVFVDIVIWLGIFSPVWIIIGGIVLWNIYKKKKKA
jgi:PKD repeat protein